MNILIADKFPEIYREELNDAGCVVHFDLTLSGDDLKEKMREISPEVLVVRSTKVTPEMIEADKNLFLIVRAGAGVNTIAVKDAAEKGIYVANCPGKNSIAVAELAFGLILACDRQISNCTKDLNNGIWNKKKYSEARGLHGCTLGLLGVGGIGKEMISRAAAFGLKVVAWSRSLNEERAKELGVTCLPTPVAVAKEADILSVHLALNPDTEGIVNEEIFNAMKEGSYFINTSRGPVVDEASLLDAMKNKGIRAGLDVFCDEPGANDSNFVNPLKNEENFVGTHHIGASTAQAQDAVASEAVRVILDFKDNGVVPNSVNLCERSPATHMLVVRHLDKIGVLASVFELLKKASINVQETENIIFDGAKAAAARIQIDSEVDSETLKDIRMSDSILAANLIKF